MDWFKRKDDPPPPPAVVRSREEVRPVTSTTTAAPQPPTAPKPPEYRALTGIDYPDPAKPGHEKRIERGDMVRDLPATSIPWLLESGHIEAVDDAPADKPKEG